METREVLLNRLNETIAQLFSLDQNIPNFDMAIYDGWTAKDVLGHITFWHESFAHNVSDIVQDITPTPLKGTYRDLNQRCFDEMRTQAVGDVLQRLKAAHSVIQKNILDARITLIPYKKGSRDYTPEEHLDIVNQHITGHLRDIRRASSTRNQQFPLLERNGS